MAILPPRPYRVHPRARRGALLRAGWLVLVAAGLLGFGLWPSSSSLGERIALAALGAFMGWVAYFQTRRNRIIQICAVRSEEVALVVKDVRETVQKGNRLLQFTLILPSGRVAVETFAKNFMWDDGGPLFTDGARTSVVALMHPSYPSMPVVLRGDLSPYLFSAEERDAILRRVGTSPASELG